MNCKQNISKTLVGVLHTPPQNKKGYLVKNPCFKRNEAIFDVQKRIEKKLMLTTVQYKL